MSTCIRRREFIAMFGSAAAWPVVARAQQPSMPVVGLLWASPPDAYLLAAFRQGLAEAGYVEGKNLAIEYRFTNFRPELLPEAVGDIVRLNVQIIFAGTPQVVAATMNA